MRKAIVIDLDGTITVDDPTSGYEAKPVNEPVREAMGTARASGYEIVVHTARNMRTYAGDLEKIHAHTKPVAVAWLDGNAVPYDGLIVGKPWCGPGGYYVDDKNLHVEEFRFRFSEEVATKTVDVVVSFYNEGPNVEAAHQANSRLHRLFSIQHFVYVDNGSTDDTGARLDRIAEHDPAVKVVHVPKNLGYGNGYKSGLAEATADFVVTNHADSQFDAYGFFSGHADRIREAIREGRSVFPRRLNRPWLDVANTTVLRGVLALVLGRRLGDFNGQPKLLETSLAKAAAAGAPNDFTFDLWLYARFPQKRAASIEVLQKARLHGRSTWNVNWRAKARLFLAYLKTALSLRLSRP